MMAIFRESMGRHTRRHTRQSVNELTHGWHYSATFLNWLDEAEINTWSYEPSFHENIRGN